MKRRLSDRLSVQAAIRVWCGADRSRLGAICGAARTDGFAIPECKSSSARSLVAATQLSNSPRADELRRIGGPYCDELRDPGRCGPAVVCVNAPLLPSSDSCRSASSSHFPAAPYRSSHSTAMRGSDRQLLSAARRDRTSQFTTAASSPSPASRRPQYGIAESPHQELTADAARSTAVDLCRTKPGPPHRCPSSKSEEREVPITGGNGRRGGQGGPERGDPVLCRPVPASVTPVTRTSPPVRPRLRTLHDRRLDARQIASPQQIRLPSVNTQTNTHTSRGPLSWPLAGNMRV